MSVGRYSFTSVLLLCFLGSQPLPGQKIDWNCSPADSPWGYATYFVRGNHNNPPGLQLQQLTRRIRHLVSASAPRGRKYLASRIGYYANSDCTFHQARLLTSGDVSLNPGPTINSSRCSVCIKNVARNHRALSCDQCELWCHMKCGRLKPSQYKHLQQKDQFNRIFPACLLSVLPFAEVPIPTDEAVHAEPDNSANLNKQGPIHQTQRPWFKDCTS